ncbi:hypothetical protein Bbelb_082390 [Branchiostoma belcheri]|nr:hypothetical protein Bbelb_082390 [Branchiostoma belcheri]
MIEQVQYPAARIVSGAMIQSQTTAATFTERHTSTYHTLQNYHIQEQFYTMYYPGVERTPHYTAARLTLATTVHHLVGRPVTTGVLLNGSPEIARWQQFFTETNNIRRALTHVTSSFPSLPSARLLAEQGIQLPKAPSRAQREAVTAAPVPVAVSEGNVATQQGPLSQPGKKVRAARRKPRERANEPGARGEFEADDKRLVEQEKTEEREKRLNRAAEILSHNAIEAAYRELRGEATPGCETLSGHNIRLPHVSIHNSEIGCDEEDLDKAPQQQWQQEEQSFKEEALVQDMARRLRRAFSRILTSEKLSQRAKERGHAFFSVENYINRAEEREKWLKRAAEILSYNAIEEAYRELRDEATPGWDDAVGT